jgi:hypothetical protein
VRWSPRLKLGTHWPKAWPHLERCALSGLRRLPTPKVNACPSNFALPTLKHRHTTAAWANSRRHFPADRTPTHPAQTHWCSTTSGQRNVRSADPRLGRTPAPSRNPHQPRRVRWPAKTRVDAKSASPRQTRSPKASSRAASSRPRAGARVPEHSLGRRASGDPRLPASARHFPTVGCLGTAFPHGRLPRHGIRQRSAASARHSPTVGCPPRHGIRQRSHTVGSS